jgi:outer membrane protein assembly factor BamB
MSTVVPATRQIRPCLPAAARSIGACDKNGDFYAFTANPLGGSPLWTDMIAAPDGTTGSCFASADWNAPAGDLYVSGGATTIGTTSYGGSVDEVNPATGAYIWRTALRGGRHADAERSDPHEGRHQPVAQDRPSYGC